MNGLGKGSGITCLERVAQHRKETIDGFINLKVARVLEKSSVSEGQSSDGYMEGTLGGRNQPVETTLFKCLKIGEK